MKTITIASFFVLFAIAASVTTPTVFADHAKATVSIPLGTNVPGCEETQACFVPHEVTIDVGGEVTWSNDDTAAHTVTSGDINAGGPDGVFDSSLFMAGATFSHKFDSAGTFKYFCMVHPWMEGVVVVQAAGAMDDDHGHEGEELMVEINTGNAAQGERLSIDVTFKTLDGHEVEHVNYNIMATQGTEVVLDEKNVHDHDGSMNHMTAPLPVAASDSMPVDVTVTLNGLGLPGEELTGPVGQVATKKVVPEFGTIAMMILGVAIVSIIAISAKSRVIPRL